MIFTKELFNPLMSFSYLQVYFDDIKIVNVNWKLRIQAHYLYLVMIYFTTICNLCYCFNVSPWMRTFIGDFVFVFEFPPITAPLMIPIAWLTIQFSRMLYIHNRNQLTDLIEGVVMNGNNDFFLTKTFNGKPVSISVRKYARVMILVMKQIFVIAVGWFCCMKFSKHFQTCCFFQSVFQLS